MYQGRTARRLRKKVEMLFAHLKCILRLDRLCGAWLRANGYASELEAAALAERARHACGVGPRDDLTLAVGRLACWIRKAAGHCPRTAKRVRRLLGIADSDPEPVFPWTSDVTPAGWDLLHATRVRAGNEPEILAPRPAS